MNKAYLYLNSVTSQAPTFNTSAMSQAKLQICQNHSFILYD